MNIRKKLQSTVNWYLTGCILASGCASSPYKVHKVNTLEQAGSTHMAVLSVAPWKKYKDAIQPQFTLTSDGALQQVLPNTADYEDRLLDAFAFRLKLGLPSTSTTSTTTTHAESGLAPVSKSDVTQTLSPADISKMTFEPPPTTSTASVLS